MDKFKSLIKPNVIVSRSMEWLCRMMWLIAFLSIWILCSAVFLPSPIDVLKAIPTLWFENQLGVNLWISLCLNFESLCWMTGVCLLISYLTVMPLFRPFGTIVSNGRFNGMVGLSLVFYSLLHNAHSVKVALLVFASGVYTVMSVTKMIEDIPKERFDLCRTLRMSEWRTVWEVVILERFDEVIDILRINASMILMFLPLVEMMYRFQGGIGPILMDQEKRWNLDAVFAGMFIMCVVGYCQDYLFKLVKRTYCPYSNLGLER